MMAEGSGRRMLFVLAIIIVIGAVAVFTGCGSMMPPLPGGTGTLAGRVSIGPLCPVEPCTVSPERLAAAYAARPITIALPGGAVVTTVTADPVNGYNVTLAPGSYVVSIPRTGIGGSRALPATVTIAAGRTTRLDIAIDTGIR